MDAYTTCKLTEMHLYYVIILKRRLQLCSSLRYLLLLSALPFAPTCFVMSLYRRIVCTRIPLASSLHSSCFLLSHAIPFLRAQELLLPRRHLSSSGKDDQDNDSWAQSQRVPKFRFSRTPDQDGNLAPTPITTSNAHYHLLANPNMIENMNQKDDMLLSKLMQFNDLITSEEEVQPITTTPETKPTDRKAHSKSLPVMVGKLNELQLNDLLVCARDRERWNARNLAAKFQISVEEVQVCIFFFSLLFLLFCLSFVLGCLTILTLLFPSSATQNNNGCPQNVLGYTAVPALYYDNEPLHSEILFADFVAPYGCHFQRYLALETVSGEKLGLAGEQAKTQSKLNEEKLQKEEAEREIEEAERKRIWGTDKKHLLQQIREKIELEELKASEDVSEREARERREREAHHARLGRDKDVGEDEDAQFMMKKEGRGQRSSRDDGR